MPDPENPKKYVPPASRQMRIMRPAYKQYCLHGCGKSFDTTKLCRQHEKKCKKKGGS